MKNTSIILKSIFLIPVSFMALSFSSCNSKKNDVKQTKNVIVYTYDSFAADWGPGEALTKAFKEETGYKQTIVKCGEPVQPLNRAILEKDNVRADVILGIDNNLAPQARAAGILVPYLPKDAESIVDQSLRAELGDDNLLTPFDYSHFALIYDTESSVPAPKCLEDLTKPEYAKKLILMDPRMSSPGLGFLAWTVGVFGDSYKDFWKKLSPSVMTMTSGWSEGWGMFLNGEAPLVISYTTSPAYNVEYDKNYRYQALVFDQGHVQQVEGYGLLAGAHNPEGAKAFMDFMISTKAQEILPLTQWMYPVNKNVALPQSYKDAAPVPAKTLTVDADVVKAAVDVVIDTLVR